MKFKAIDKTNKIYLSSFNLTVYSSVFILFSLILLPLVSSYVNVGGALIRFSSIYQDLNTFSALVLIAVSVLSILSLSAFVSAIISIVKLRETLDHFSFERVAKTFKKYVLRVFSFFFMLSVASMLFGSLLSYLGAPDFIIQLFMIVLWLPFIFAPQVLIIEDMGIMDAMEDSWTFIKKQPVSLVIYLVAGFLMMFILLLIETFLGQYLVWEHKIISIIILSLFIMPYLEMLATELYITRYAVARL